MNEYEFTGKTVEEAVEEATGLLLLSLLFVSRSGCD